MGQTDILTLKGKFTACQKMLTVFGDEVRQRLLLLMLEGDPNGVRVADISDKMKLTPLHGWPGRLPCACAACRAGWLHFSA